MGNQQSKDQNGKQDGFESQLEYNSVHSSAWFGQYEVLIHSSNATVQKHTHYCNSQSQFESHYKAYKWRRFQTCIVCCYHISYEPIKEWCNRQGIKVNMYIQDPEMRLSEIRDIPYPQNLYVLQCSLLGFKRLYEQIGAFEVSEELVCLDKQGQVKVWLNADLSLNYPLRLLQSQQEMVQSILVIICSNTDHSTEPISFKDYLKDKYIQHITFQRMLSAVQQYAIDHAQTVPNKLQSVADIIKLDSIRNNPLSKNNIQSQKHFSSSRMLKVNNKASLKTGVCDNKGITSHSLVSLSNKNIKKKQSASKNKSSIEQISPPPPLLNTPHQNNNLIKSYSNNNNNNSSGKSDSKDRQFNHLTSNYTSEPMSSIHHNNNNNEDKSFHNSQISQVIVQNYDNDDDTNNITNNNNHFGFIDRRPSIDDRANLLRSPILSSHKSKSYHRQQQDIQYHYTFTQGINNSIYNNIKKNGNNSIRNNNSTEQILPKIHLNINSPSIPLLVSQNIPSAKYNTIQSIVVPWSARKKIQNNNTNISGNNNYNNAAHNNSNDNVYRQQRQEMFAIQQQKFN